MEKKMEERQDRNSTMIPSLQSKRNEVDTLMTSSPVTVADPLFQKVFFAPPSLTYLPEANTQDQDRLFAFSSSSYNQLQQQQHRTSSNFAFPRHYHLERDAMIERKSSSTFFQQQQQLQSTEKTWCAPLRPHQLQQHISCASPVIMGRISLESGRASPKYHEECQYVTYQ
uniref:Uncharacterized protein n=1 Tax=Proboscia inermis TaxID=420281 RepID=A0A7S0CK43_9STRA|mmetsp:Transcript_51713/g.52118  ORF Transcript_51713/g.52118 Transcript_51713/m.52118 type:complete len:170 (+) Transcript_51713:90-599(+)